MNRDEIAQRVHTVIARELRKPESLVKPGASFVRDLQADSLQIVELVIAIEREFELKIPDDEAEKLRTVQDATNYIVASLS